MARREAGAASRPRSAPRHALTLGGAGRRAAACRGTRRLTGRAATPGIDVAMITEGTYPFVRGGVSVWCDQILTGLTEHSFSIYALTATGTEPSVWRLPPNVHCVVPVATWGRALRRRRPSRTLEARFGAAHEQLLAALADPTGDPGFSSALHEMWEFGQRGELTDALLSDHSVARVLAAMRTQHLDERPIAVQRREPVVADAVQALRLVEHVLRPFSIEPPDAQLCHAVANGPSALLAMSAKWARGVPFVMTEHGVYLRERYLEYHAGTMPDPVRSHLLNFYRHVTEAGYRAADVIAPCCEYNRLWEHVNGADDVKIHPIFNGVDADQFPLAQAEPDTPTVAWVGRVDPLKDLETLLRAFKSVHQEIPAARLRMFGPVPEGNEAYYRRCLSLRAELGLDAVASFEGPVSPVAHAYHAGTVVALTSISEGFPYVLLEAMATGRAIIATSVGGISEVMGDSGLVVPPRDPNAASLALTKLLRDEPLRRRLAVAGRERVLSEFTLNRCLSAYARLYQESVQRGRAASAHSTGRDVMQLPAQVPALMGAQAP